MFSNLSVQNMFAIHSKIQDFHFRSYAGDFLAEIPVLNRTGVPYMKNIALVHKKCFAKLIRRSYFIIEDVRLQHTV